MSELVVGSIAGLAANSYVVDVAAGSTLDLTNATSLPSSALPTGSVLQVVSTTKTDTFSTTSTSFTDITGLSATITPRSTSSKIVVMVTIPFGCSSATAFTGLTIADGSGNNLLLASSPGNRKPSFRFNLMGDINGLDNASFQFVHSPSTTSSFTYKVQALTTSGTFYANRGSGDADQTDRGRGVSTITVMEIAG